MKRLFALINPKGKTKEQLKDELWQAWEKYKESEKKTEDDLIVDVTEKEAGTGYVIMGIPMPGDKKKL